LKHYLGSVVCETVSRQYMRSQRIEETLKLKL